MNVCVAIIFTLFGEVDNTPRILVVQDQFTLIFPCAFDLIWPNLKQTVSLLAPVSK